MPMSPCLAHSPFHLRPVRLSPILYRVPQYHRRQLQRRDAACGLRLVPLTLLLFRTWASVRDGRCFASWVRRGRQISRGNLQDAASFFFCNGAATSQATNRRSYSPGHCTELAASRAGCSGDWYQTGPSSGQPIALVQMLPPRHPSTGHQAAHHAAHQSGLTQLRVRACCAGHLLPSTSSSACTGHRAFCGRKRKRPT